MSTMSNGLSGEPDKLLRIAIVGAGFSGTMAAIHLLRQSDSARIELIDKRIPGRGLAYSTSVEQHLLNVPAIRMSAFGNEPHHFLTWWQERNGKTGAEAGSFAPRKLYGSYVQDVFETTVRAAKPNARIQQHFSFVTGLHFDGALVHLTLENGSRLEVDKTVLALGNEAPRDLVDAQPGYFSSPWESGALTSFAPDGRVLLIGSGLTAVDAFLALEARGHAGEIHIVSRRGQLPKAHESYKPLAEPFPIERQTTARTLLRSIRAATKKAEAEGTNWRAVIDSLRPVTNELWTQLPEADRLRVFRHLKTWWDIHRHRKAPEIAMKVQEAIASRHLIVHAGRLRTVSRNEEGLEAKIGLRDGSLLTLDVERVINCTGPESDYRSSKNPLIRSLLASGHAVPGGTGRGFRTTAKGELINRDGQCLEWLTALGPLRLGDLFETIAVPELRRQAEALANHLLATNREPEEVLPEIFMAAGI